MTRLATGRRRCLACGAEQAIDDNEPVWPAGWRCPACAHVVAESAGIAALAPELADTVSGMDPSSFKLLAEVEDEHFWFVARNELLAGLAARFFPDARQFLEVGCGNGAVLRAIALSRSWRRLVGSELHPSGLAFARTRLPDVEFVQMDARHIPASAAFDLIGAFDVIEHIADDERVLGEIRRALVTGGGVIIAVPQHPWLWSRADEIAYHERRYRRGELEEKLQRSGFEVLFSTSYASLLLPMMIASRLRGRGTQTNEQVEREFTLDPRINGLFMAILRAEVRLTLAGLRWPAGGSRVVVGRAI
ncbi:methyltransferase type 12 [Bradyrhizobium centrolobii]|uniref:Methyltransferase type 12 n=1 Tax=Bradyrhizobium centrolobii TaxID=1505087 RepID=A0A176YCJ3_9BRAD|nr:class I SAM-dependent methyltransferase [Bradyrhizobium centrolobii]OAF01338.1 methyltransferase type 12 [Bradyrhizobium centrolobii]